MKQTALIRSLQRDMDKYKDEETKSWFESYMKGAISYRGIKSPLVLDLVKTWRKREALEVLPKEVQLSLACDLIREKHAEDKFAGTIYIQRFLLKELSLNELMDCIEELFDEGHFSDWSTTDWFAVRVLMPLIKRHGAPAQKRIMSWHRASNLWKRRASMVSLRAIVGDSNLTPLIGLQMKRLLPTSERFLQTAIGWVLADLAKYDSDLAEILVGNHLADLSMEVLRRHTKKLPSHKKFLSDRRRLASSQK